MNLAINALQAEFICENASNWSASFERTTRKPSNNYGLFLGWIGVHWRERAATGQPMSPSLEREASCLAAVCIVSLKGPISLIRLESRVAKGSQKVTKRSPSTLVI